MKNGDEEELYRGMGDGSDSYENVVVENMWNNSDYDNSDYEDKSNTEQEEERFENDSKLKDNKATEDERHIRDGIELPSCKTLTNIYNQNITKVTMKKKLLKKTK